MSKQTSIQWFIEQLKNVGLDDILEKLPNTIGHAQQMHKEEIVSAYRIGNTDDGCKPEKYYQETYGDNNE